jgi:phosphonate transport system ATP-binding protein
MTPAFSLRAATVVFGQLAALRDVSLEIGAGEQVAVVGPSGGGKTTLLRALNGTVPLASGSAVVFGQPLDGLEGRRLRQLRSRIGFIPQSLGLVPGYRVLQNVMLGRAGRRSLAGSLRDLLLPARSEVEAVYRLLGEVGIAEKLYERAATLSAGQQQRTAIARVLYQDAAAILADEPVSNVDPARARNLVELLLRVSRDHGITLVMSLHHVDLAREFFPRVLGLRHGRTAFDGPPSGVGKAAWEGLFDLGGEEVAG